ncbi:MAG: hypothetical protein RLZZ495_1294, partial [Pseudomonadota bacterium]
MTTPQISRRLACAGLLLPLLPLGGCISNPLKAKVVPRIG